MTSESINVTFEGSTTVFNKTITRTYETTGMIGRYKGLTVATGTSPAEYDVSYGYDTYSRILSVTNGINNDTFISGSNLVKNIVYPHLIKENRRYLANADQVQRVRNRYNGSAVSKYVYIYDAFYRRTSMLRGGSIFTTADTVSYSYNTRNEVTSAQSADYDFDFSYDTIGNRTSAVLSSPSGGSSVPFSFTFNDENRITATESAYGTDVPYYALADANKNITEYFDTNANAAAYYEYAMFGKITASSGTMADDFDYRFSSEIADTETGLYNYRYYSAELGRWLSRDLIWERGSIATLTANSASLELEIITTQNEIRNLEGMSYSWWSL